jgi:hypothetical protein
VRSKFAWIGAGAIVASLLLAGCGTSVSAHGGGTPVSGGTGSGSGGAAAGGTSGGPSSGSTGGTSSGGTASSGGSSSGGTSTSGGASGGGGSSSNLPALTMAQIKLYALAPSDLGTGYKVTVEYDSTKPPTAADLSGLIQVAQGSGGCKDFMNSYNETYVAHQHATAYENITLQQGNSAYVQEWLGSFASPALAHQAFLATQADARGCTGFSFKDSTGKIVTAQMQSGAASIAGGSESMEAGVLLPGSAPIVAAIVRYGSNLVYEQTQGALSITQLAQAVTAKLGSGTSS